MTRKNQVTINGERHSFDSDTTLVQLLAALGLPPERVAIELDRAIVKRELWPATTFESGAEIEIVQFVGGG